LPSERFVFLNDSRTLILVLGVIGVLGVAWLVGRILRGQVNGGMDPAIVAKFNRRVNAWWIMAGALAAAFLMGYSATVVLFGIISFWALREFITLTPTRIADHRALFWVFFVFTPLQYVLVGLQREALYSILIPVYAFLFIPARVAFAGDFKRFLERTAKIQAGLMICVYCLSYAPAILSLDEAQILKNAPLGEINVAAADPAASAPAKPALNAQERQTRNARLLFFFILIVQLGDVLHLAAEKLFGKYVIAPAIHQGRTWTGMLGGISATTLLGMIFWWATPFNIFQVAILSFATALMGFAGGLTMSAIKRDRGVRDYGTLVEGHGGVLDRIDSICFAAPVFFQICKYTFYFNA
jgi:phosphatidate cytidylyltransferase